MDEAQRKRGGDNNKRGNRYEDFFATFRLMQFAPQVMKTGAMVRLKEQAGCPVDDLLLVATERRFYHQMKADKSITWGADNGKMENEFRQQMLLSQQANESFQLLAVVADTDRLQSLNKHMPADLDHCTQVLHFPRIQRLAELVRHPELINGVLREVYAGRRESATEYKNTVRAFYTAWIDHEPDDNGFCVLNTLISTIQSWRLARICHAWKDRPAEWPEVERILNAIPNLQWFVDRGFFEWSYPPTDYGLMNEPCESDSFKRFISRLLKERPQSFTQFEMLYP